MGNIYTFDVQKGISREKNKSAREEFSITPLTPRLNFQHEIFLLHSREGGQAHKLLKITRAQDYRIKFRFHTQKWMRHFFSFLPQQRGT